MKKPKLIQPYHPIKTTYWLLDSNEFNNPYKVLEYFFFMDNLSGHRQELWNFFKVAVSGNYQSLDQVSRENLLFLHEQVLKLVEALHVLYVNGEIKRNSRSS